eukprot:451239-Hanusia_phi.AAC.1
MKLADVFHICCRSLDPDGDSDAPLLQALGKCRSFSFLDLHGRRGGCSDLLLRKYRDQVTSSWIVRRKDRPTPEVDDLRSNAGSAARQGHVHLQDHRHSRQAECGSRVPPLSVLRQDLHRQAFALLPGQERERAWEHIAEAMQHLAKTQGDQDVVEIVPSQLLLHDPFFHKMLRCNEKHGKDEASGLRYLESCMEQEQDFELDDEVIDRVEKYGKELLGTFRGGVSQSLSLSVPGLQERFSGGKVIHQFHA